MTWRLAPALAGVSLLLGGLALPLAAAGADTAPVVRLTDPRIEESSGLVDLGTSWVTTNDSGDSARLFVISPRTGKTVGLVTLRTSVRDVEALAPAGPSAVWVADIGDNRGERSSVSVFRVPVGTGRIDVTPRRYRLVYPHGRPDAESIVVDRQGRLNIITKAFVGGVVYRAPARLSATRPNRLTAVARVREYATDAARTRDGRHVIVRGPFVAGVYTLPGWKRVGQFALPRQLQGEGISVGPTGTVRVSSEGARSVVREVRLPAELLARITPTPSPPPSASPSPSATPSPTASPTSDPAPDPGDGDSTGGLGAIDPPWLMWCIPAVIALGAIGIGIGLRRRSE